jgi:hypothetical protein
MTQPLRNCGAVPFAALLLLAACGDNGTEPKPSTGPDLAGDWTIIETMSNATRGIFCQATGVLTLASTELGFNGTVDQVGQCDTPAGTVDNSGTGKITDGRTTPTDVTFREPGCRYTGQHYHTPPDSAAGTVTCSASVDGQDFNLTGTWYMVAGADRVPPTVTDAEVIQTDLLVPGDAFGIAVAAQDDRALAWVGFQLGAPISLRDSVAVSGATARDTFQLVVQAGWVGSTTFTAFARDELGGLTESSGPNIVVSDMVRLPLHTLNVGAEAYGGAYDAKRNRLYIPQPSLARIAVVDLASFTLAAPISITAVFPPRANAGLTVDITPGMDSLVIGSADGADPSVAFLDLVSGTLTPVALADSGRSIRTHTPVLTDHDRLLLFGEISLSVGSIQAGLWSYDIQAGTIRRQQLGMGLATAAARTADGKVAAALSNPPNCGWRYDPATDTIGVCLPIGSVNTAAPLSADATGSLWLMGGDLLDANFVQLRSMGGAWSALLPDGSAGWFNDILGLVERRVSDGVQLMSVRVPAVAGNAIRVLPDGHRLLILNTTGGSSITLVDLP